MRTFPVRTNVDVQPVSRLEVSDESTLSSPEKYSILFHTLGDYLQAFGNARNSSSTCMPTNNSQLCVGQCSDPAVCSSITGRCTCPTGLVVINSLSSNTQTCQCADHPLSFYNGTSCVRVVGKSVDDSFDRSQGHFRLR